MGLLLEPCKYQPQGLNPANVKDALHPHINIVQLQQQAKPHLERASNTRPSAALKRLRKPREAKTVEITKSLMQFGRNASPSSQRALPLPWHGPTPQNPAAWRTQRRTRQ